MKADDLQILKECKRWQEKYGLKVDSDTDKLLEGIIAMEEDDLTSVDKKQLDWEREKMKHMELDELLKHLNVISFNEK